MSAVMLEAPVRVADRALGLPATIMGGEPTLDESLSRVWERLVAHGAAACPICDGRLRPVYGAHALALGGRCADCGTLIT